MKIFKILLIFGVYSLVFPLIFLLLLCLFFFKVISLQEFLERLGKVPLEKTESSLIWIHVASIGEWNTASNFLSILNKKTKQSFLVTYFNKDINSSSFSLNKSFVKVKTLLPMENPLSFLILIKYYKIKILIVTELEIWPILLLITKTLKVNIYLVNANLFKKEAIKYAYFKSLFKIIFNTFTKIYPTTFNSYENFLNVGVNKHKLKIYGDFKFDLVNREINQKVVNLFNRFPPLPTIILASLHYEEIEIIFQELKEMFKNKQIRIILAPRNINNIKKWITFFKNNHISILQKSNIKHRNSNTLKQELQLGFNNILLDTYGELYSLFQVASLVIIGGSFTSIGGHNILEPIFFNKKTIIGKYYFHFENSVQLFKEKITIIDRNSLKEEVEKLLEFEKNENFYKEDNGRKMLLKLQGISQKVVDNILNYESNI